MNKWGVRLIAVYVFLWAISDFYKLITGNGRTHGFFGFVWMFSNNGNSIDFMAWLQAIVLVGVGINLLRFQSGGRYWALFIFWWTSIMSAGFLIWMIVVSVIDLSKGEIPGLAVNLNNLIWGGEIRGFSAAFYYFVVILIFYFIPLYFLMRKDIKQLFEKSVTTVENNPNPEAPMP